MNHCGDLRKMHAELRADGTVDYHLPLGDEQLPLAPLIGRRISLIWQGEIHCIHCGRKTSRSFNQGYCFPCLRRLARCDTCIVKPELCHYHRGTCREPEWAKQHCFQPHVVYLANSSALKVGITRQSQIPTRWLDQGATQALPILRVADRRSAGRLEVILKRFVSDRTQWHRMLRGEAEPLDLPGERDRLLAYSGDLPEDVERLTAETVTIRYPVLTYPRKVKACNFAKNPRVEGILLGIKGQYLLLDSGVINIRKFAGYRVTLIA